ncbi:MAG: iron-containing alcohol dehydrogenase [Syntrophomonadaceae bacterium]|jgi:alcohol dehydrogenase class IV|nr:iron-containing alcohol dehydrogenase [Bacillota bacterium]NLM88789.1 iron-containing alcohol dehydrogenase [Syntrophomonadaceae bacterium]HAA09049.1 alcohol dehydrogenase [Syntrophomonas sp.]HQA50173.1 iron-containing alcohol dehydrogenase [Syntrophomonadaceae bacterium]HQD91063.1 iron-containing alcohol dehydrogenase [Syntrophomonadaceae bacterium]
MATPKYFMWDYRSVVEVGSGCRTFIPQRFMDMGCKRIGLITDAGIVSAGIVEQVEDIFTAQGQPRIVGIYDKIEPDAVMRVVNDCARWCRELAVDGLLAVGGGSVLDTVKGVKFLLGMGEIDIKEVMPGNIGPYMRPLGQPLNVPHIAVPTTAGTGSESSPIAVIYNEDTKVKGDLLHPYLPADYAFLDPDFTLGLPPKMTADTGFDALSHAVEAISSPGTNCMIDALSIQAIKLICQYLPIAVENGKNLEARTKMLVASNMAIMSFAMSGLFYPIHNVAHAVGGQLRVPHGEANAVLIPILMEQYPKHYLNNATVLADAFGVNTAGMTGEEMVTAAAQKVKELQQKCGVKPKFTQNIDEETRELMYWAVKFDPAGLFYPLPDEVIRGCIADAYE